MTTDSNDTTGEFLWLVIVGGFVCFIMGIGIGANDVANAFSTSVGAKSLTLRQAVLIAVIFEFAGAFFLGAEVTDTVRKKITDYSAFEGEEDLLMLGMFASLIAGAIWLYIATRFSVPVSTTQTIVGAIIGFVLAYKGGSAVVWDAVYQIIIFWVASPVLSGIGFVLLFVPTRALILRNSDSYELALKVWPFYVFLVAFIMTLFMILKGLARFDLDESLGMRNASWISILVGLAMALIFYIAFIRTGIVHKHVTSSLEKAAKEAADKVAENEKDADAVIAMEKLKSGSKSAGDDTYSSVEVESRENTPEALQPYASAVALVKRGLDVDIHSDLEQLEINLHEKAEKFDPRTEKAFSYLQVCSAILDIFAHGSNDVANAVAPFAAMVALYEVSSVHEKVDVPMWVLAVGAIGMAIGLATFGYRVMKSLGVRMATMTASRGYCIELSSALVVILASYYGFPASTTHTQVGATVSAGLCELANKDSKLTWKHVVNWKLLGQVFLGWVFTLLVSGGTSAIIFSFMAWSPYAGDVTHE